MTRHTFIFLLLLAAGQLIGNNIEVNNISLTGQNPGNQTTQVQFDLSWENSWRISVGPANWDAAWVFVKYRVNGDLWRHATLNTSGAVAAAGAQIDVTADGVGAFIYRDADGSGNVDFSDLQLRWDYGTDGVDDDALVDVQVFAVEMVYVPEGEFRIGTTIFGTEVNAFYTNVQIGAFFLRQPYLIQGEGAITVSAAAGNLYYADDPGTDGGDQAGPIPAAFPKGFNAFYSMKYEVSQDQWIGFFNSLTPNQKANLDVTGSDGKNADDEFARNGVSWADAGSATTTLPDVPLNYVRTNFTLSYLDWAGLRPMTELEYEKAGRGPLGVVAEGYAWGSTNIHATPYEYQNLGMPNEIITNPGTGAGNAIYSATNGAPTGPKRCGIAPASALVNNREDTGGSYYGIMELTGNLYERTVTVGTPTGRGFTGVHGDGQLNSSGAYNVANWPTPNGDGIGYRGGSYANGAERIRLSDRFDGANVIAVGNSRLGFRGVRTAE